MAKLFYRPYSELLLLLTRFQAFASLHSHFGPPSFHQWPHCRRGILDIYLIASPSVSQRAWSIGSSVHWFVRFTHCRFSNVSKWPTHRTSYVYPLAIDLCPLLLGMLHTHLPVRYQYHCPLHCLSLLFITVASTVYTSTVHRPTNVRSNITLNTFARLTHSLSR